jgi:transcriptional regulator with XRE-family HTH domain
MKLLLPVLWGCWNCCTLFPRMDAETERLVNLVKVCLRILGISNRELARRLEMSPSYVSKLLSGSSELRLDHLVRICKVTGLDPGEFFALAYPVRPTATATGARLRLLLQGSNPPQPPPPPVAPAKVYREDEVQAMLQAALERLIKGGGGE